MWRTRARSCNDDALSTREPLASEASLVITQINTNNADGNGIKKQMLKCICFELKRM